MKNSWRIVWITSGILAAIGLILCSMALILGVSLEKLSKYGSHMEIERDSSFLGRIYQDDEDDIDGEMVGRIQHTADLSRTRFSGISELYVEMSHCEVEILPTEDTEVLVDSSELEYGSSGLELIVEQTDDELEIINYKNDSPWDGRTYLPGIDKSSYGCLRIYIPQDQYLSFVDLSLGACTAQIQDLCAEVLQIDAGDGSCEARSVDVEQLNAEIGDGELELDGAIRDQAYLHCGAGEIELKLENRYEYFDYDFQSDRGDIQIGGHSYDGFYGNNYIGNGSPHLMEISCGSGSVDIEFASAALSSSDGGDSAQSSVHHAEDDDAAGLHHDEDHE